MTLDLFAPKKHAPTLHHGDCLAVLKTLDDASVDAVVTDPPYLIDFMGKGWDSADGIAGKPEVWAECLRVLKPGGHLLAFGATRTYHRMTCAIEDAGFEIRDSIHWLYSTGFPKSLNIGDGRGTALKPAHEPVVVARKPLAGTVAANVERYGTGALNIDASRVSAVQGDEPLRWAHGRSMGFHGAKDNGPCEALTSAGRWPPNIVLSHTEDCTESACDETCAVAELNRQSGTKQGKGQPTVGGSPRSKSAHIAQMSEQPRTNAIMDYGDSGGASRFFPVFRYQAKASRSERGVYLTCDCKAGTVPAWVNAVRSQPGKTVVTSPAKGTSEETSEAVSGCNTSLCGSERTVQSLADGKSITSTKTNSTIDWKTSDCSQQSNTSGFIADASYAAASGSSRVVSAVSESPSTRTTSTSLGKVGRCTGVAVPAMSESLWKGKSCGVCGSAIRGEGHATVKPIALMEWLVTLVTPPGGVVLDPFMGSGTTGVAAVRKGFRFVGIEREDEYLAIARARIEAA